MTDKIIYMIILQYYLTFNLEYFGKDEFLGPISVSLKIIFLLNKQKKINLLLQDKRYC